MLAAAGIYKYNPVFFVWDVVNLFNALPLFVIASIASIASLRNSLRGRLLLDGLLVLLAVSPALLLIRKSACGYCLCSVAMVVGLMMSIAIPFFALAAVFDLDVQGRAAAARGRG